VSVKLLLVTLYFPPAGGGGVQRPLKFASHLPALGIETHVLAPDDPKWLHEDADLPLPTQAWVHRARYLGPRGRRLADELHGRSDSIPARVKAQATRGVAALVARRADAIVTAADAIADEARTLNPRGRVVTIENGCDFDDFAGMEYARADVFRITHTGSFFGRRDPKPFLRALADSALEDVNVRFVGDFRPGDREFMTGLGLAVRVALIDHVP